MSKGRVEVDMRSLSLSDCQLSGLVGGQSGNDPAIGAKCNSQSQQDADKIPTELLTCSRHSDFLTLNLSISRNSISTGVLTRGDDNLQHQILIRGQDDIGVGAQ
jgi:hypothetical protein